MKRQLEAFIDQAPPGYFDPKLQKHLPKIKQRLLKMADLIDDLGLLDEQTQEVYINENSLRRLVKEASPEAGEGVLARLSEFPDSRLTRGRKGMRSIPWETLAERLAPTVPSSGRDTGAQVSQYSSLAEIERAVREHYPEIPPGTFEGETLYHQFRAVLDAPAPSNAAARGPNAWDCMLRKLGWFVATMVVVIVAVVAVIVAFMTIAFPLVPALTAAWWPLFWSAMWTLGYGGIMAGNSLATLILVISCVVNPAG